MIKTKPILFILLISLHTYLPKYISIIAQFIQTVNENHKKKYLFAISDLNKSLGIRIVYTNNTLLIHVLLSIQRHVNREVCIK